MKMQESQNNNVLCDACHGNEKLTAVKSCLQCVTSFCETHLENHKTAARLMKHKLIDPVENLEDYICEKHEKPLEFFCRDDRLFLCLICFEIGHNTHNIVLIEQESGGQRTQLVQTQAEVEMMIQDRIKKTEEIKSSVKTNKNNSVKILTALIHCIEKCQAELLDVMEQKQKTAEKQAKELIKELEQEITELKRRHAELEMLSHTKDHLHFLQTCSSVSGPPQVKSWTSNIIDMNIDLNTEILDKALQSLQEKIKMELKNFFEITHCPHRPSIVQETSGSDSGSTDSVPSHPLLVFESSSVMEKRDVSAILSKQQDTLTEVLKPTTSSVQTEDKIYFNDKSSTPSPKSVEKINKKVFVTADLSTIQKLYAVNVILDPNTAYPKLNLSKDGKQVKHGGSWRDVPNNPERFNSSACVLGKDGFSCGKFYYEVEVGEKTEWDLGVARESIKRKGKITVCPNKGFWCIWLRNGCEYVANESHPVSISLKDKPQKVGVFVDYEEGLVSFYNVGTKALIYSFTGQSFTEKIYPFFSPCNKRRDENTMPLIISTSLCNY
ncbi:E3 ubiquitin-protein ligase TRIM39 [Carassius auratus]|uniref:E3 ubiquitin-protein ligase TRIM39-like n=1 Tax=Carassius auratus TaxID=7957 RepID=A0A6P6KNM9_CARAU|nr:E3 ubiquitin-protein ligase TRIM39-like [Carassius auratus]XP_026072732.1 E3 ubiquitin-protein ligase TRIM39-like [Carassius auratus]